jgi:hypothetical protein
VILFYITAVVMPEDGTVRFAEDIYGHDARLEKALARRQPEALALLDQTRPINRDHGGLGASSSLDDWRSPVRK